MTKMVECPKKGCKIVIPDDRMCCTKHWRKASNEKRVAWMRRHDQQRGKTWRHLWGLPT